MPQPFHSRSDNYQQEFNQHQVLGHRNMNDGEWRGYDTATQNEFHHKPYLGVHHSTPSLLYDYEPGTVTHNETFIPSPESINTNNNHLHSTTTFDTQIHQQYQPSYSHSQAYTHSTTSTVNSSLSQTTPYFSQPYLQPTLSNYNQTNTQPYLPSSFPLFATYSNPPPSLDLQPTYFPTNQNQAYPHCHTSPQPQFLWKPQQPYHQTRPSVSLLPLTPAPDMAYSTWSLKSDELFETQNNERDESFKEHTKNMETISKNICERNREEENGKLFYSKPVEENLGVMNFFETECKVQSRNKLCKAELEQVTVGCYKPVSCNMTCGNDGLKEGDTFYKEPRPRSQTSICKFIPSVYMFFKKKRCKLKVRKNLCFALFDAVRRKEIECKLNRPYKPTVRGKKYPIAENISVSSTLNIEYHIPVARGYPTSVSPPSASYNPPWRVDNLFEWPLVPKTSTKTSVTHDLFWPNETAGYQNNNLSVEQPSFYEPADIVQDKSKEPLNEQCFGLVKDQDHFSENVFYSSEAGSKAKEKPSKSMDENNIQDEKLEDLTHHFAREPHIASPLLMDYAPVGTVDLDPRREYMGTEKDGKKIVQSVVWSTKEKVAEIDQSYVWSDLFKGSCEYLQPTYINDPLSIKNVAMSRPRPERDKVAYRQLMERTSHSASQGQLGMWTLATARVMGHLYPRIQWPSDTSIPERMKTLALVLFVKDFSANAPKNLEAGRNRILQLFIVMERPPPKPVYEMMPLHRRRAKLMKWF